MILLKKKGPPICLEGRRAARSPIVLSPIEKDRGASIRRGSGATRSNPSFRKRLVSRRHSERTVARDPQFEPQGRTEHKVYIGEQRTREDTPFKGNQGEKGNGFVELFPNKKKREAPATQKQEKKNLPQSIGGRVEKVAGSQPGRERKAR